jgi:CheY-like chemotaxis protein
MGLQDIVHFRSGRLNRECDRRSTTKSSEPTVTRVLVIDDDNSVGLAIQSMLARQGCDIVLAQDGNTGIDAFEASKFDVTMIDIFIPGMDGLKIIKTARERRPEAPIVAMSGFRFRSSMASNLDFLGMAVQLGATCCLRKPFTSEQLIAAVNACLPATLSLNHSVGIREATQGATQ